MIVAQRVFSTLYIYLDIAFLVGFCALLAAKKKYLTLLWGIFGGALYMAVDYGIFHLLTHSRSIEGGNMFWVLLWMSMSYGITNFVWIWLWFSRDENCVEWTALILLWWLVAPVLANAFGQNFPTIKIQRTTGAYHWVMALILFVGYVGAILYNLFQPNPKKRLPLLWLAATGISVQLAWEFSLLVGGIRSAEFATLAEKLHTLVVNSLLETNLGAVPIYLICVAVTAKYNENLSRRKDAVSLGDRIAELNERRKI